MPEDREATIDARWRRFVELGLPHHAKVCDHCQMIHRRTFYAGALAFHVAARIGAGPSAETAGAHIDKLHNELTGFLTAVKDGLV